MSKKNKNLTRQGVRNLDVILGKRPSQGRKADLTGIPGQILCKHPEHARKEIFQGLAETCTLCGEQWDRY
jgi:hypothetical protein